MTFAPRKPENESGTVDVRVLKYVNLYRYNKRNLLIAYGAAFCITTMAVALGLYTMIDVGDSYDNLFSTFLRTTRDHRLNDLVGTAVARGMEPLPKDLAQKTLILRTVATGDYDAAPWTSFIPEEEYIIADEKGGINTAPDVMGSKCADGTIVKRCLTPIGHGDIERTSETNSGDVEETGSHRRHPEGHR